MQWTEQQIVDMAPDASAVKAGRDLHGLQNGSASVPMDYRMWGERQGSGFGSVSDAG